MVEDETDVLAARELKAEVVADNAEFDEDNIVIWDEETSKKKQFDCQYKFENELKSIENEVLFNSSSSLIFFIFCLLCSFS